MKWNEIFITDFFSFNYLPEIHRKSVREGQKSTNNGYKELIHHYTGDRIKGETISKLNTICEYDAIKSKYNLFHLNINSLGFNLEDLELLTFHLGKMIIIWNSYVKEENKYYNLPGYVPYFNSGDNCDGGVALFVHISLASGLVVGGHNKWR